MNAYYPQKVQHALNPSLPPRLFRKSRTVNENIVFGRREAKEGDLRRTVATKHLHSTHMFPCENPMNVQ